MNINMTLTPCPRCGCAPQFYGFQNRHLVTCEKCFSGYARNFVTGVYHRNFMAGLDDEDTGYKSQEEAIAAWEERAKRLRG